MDKSLRSDKSMLPHNASPHSPRSSIPLRHGKGSGSFGLVDVTDAKEPAFSLPILAPATSYTAASAPVARPFCTPAFGPRILRPYAPLRADWSGSASGYAALPPSARPPYTAPSAPVARPFCTPAFGPRILRPYAPLRADWSGSASGYGGGRCLLIVRQPAAEESFFTFAP